MDQDDTEWSRMIRDGASWYQVMAGCVMLVFLTVLYEAQMVKDGSGWSRMVQDGARWCQVGPGGARWYQVVLRFISILDCLGVQNKLHYGLVLRTVILGVIMLFMSTS